MTHERLDEALKVVKLAENNKQNARVLREYAMRIEKDNGYLSEFLKLFSVEFKKDYDDIVMAICLTILKMLRARAKEFDASSAEYERQFAAL